MTTTPLLQSTATGYQFPGIVRVARQCVKREQ